MVLRNALCSALAALVTLVFAEQARAIDYTFTTIDVGAVSTSASGINDLGQIVGTFQNATGTHGFLRDTDGTITQIDVGDSVTYVQGIDGDCGTVGWFQRPNGDINGFTRGCDGFIIPVGVGVSAYVQVLGISSDTSAEVGYFEDNTVRGHGWLYDVGVPIKYYVRIESKVFSQSCQTRHATTSDLVATRHRLVISINF